MYHRNLNWYCSWTIRNELNLWKQLNQELVPDYEIVYFSSHFHQVFTNPVELEEKLKSNFIEFNQTERGIVLTNNLIKQTT